MQPARPVPKMHTPKKARRWFHRLSAADQQQARDLAKFRYLDAREVGRPDLQIGGQNPLEMELEGLAGEIAFARLIGVEPEIVVGRPDDGYDCTLPDGRRVDVKTSSLSRPNLIARKIAKAADLFVLVRGSFPAYEVLGWIDRESFERAPKKKLSARTAPTHFYAAENLHPLDTLLPSDS